MCLNYLNSLDGSWSFCDDCVQVAIMRQSPTKYYHLAQKWLRMSVNLAAFFVVQKLHEREWVKKKEKEKEKGKRPSEAPSLQSELNEI